MLGHIYSMASIENDFDCEAFMTRLMIIIMYPGNIMAQVVTIYGVVLQIQMD